MGVSEGGVPPQKLENCVFLKLKSCNLVNTFWCKFRVGNEFKSFMDLTMDIKVCS